MSDGSKQIAEDAVQEIASDLCESDVLFTSHSSMDDHTYVSKYQDSHAMEELMRIRRKSASPFDCSSSDPGYESITTSPPRLEENFDYNDFINWDLF